MKKTPSIQSAVIVLLFLVLVGFRCKKDNSDKFCEISRSEFKTVNNKEGMIGYYAKYNRWAVYLKVDSLNNIDSRIIGLTCNMPASLQIDGLSVILTGIFKNFNTDEKITPQMGGDELYYFEFSKIVKK